MLKKAFTLLELISVVFIIAIISSVALISVDVLRRSLSDKDKLSVVMDIQLSLESYRSINSFYPADLSELAIDLSSFSDIDYASFQDGDYYYLYFYLNKHDQYFNKGRNCLSPLGKCHYYLSFDGVDDYIQIPHNANLKPSTEMTFGGWIKFNSFAAWNYLLDTNSGAMPRQIILTEGNRLYLYYDIGASGLSYVAGPYLNTDTWYHLVWSYNGSNLKGYINGVEVINLALSGQINHAENDMLMASFAGNNRLNGSIKDVFIYNRALSVAEVNSLYGEQVLQDGLLAYWPMNDFNSCTLLDMGPYKNDANLMPNCPSNNPVWIVDN